MPHHVVHHHLLHRHVLVHHILPLTNLLLRHPRIVAACANPSSGPYRAGPMPIPPGSSQRPQVPISCMVPIAARMAVNGPVAAADILWVLRCWIRPSARICAMLAPLRNPLSNSAGSVLLAGLRGLVCGLWHRAEQAGLSATATIAAVRIDSFMTSISFESLSIASLRMRSTYLRA
jgi:hypothetical protein